MSITDANDERPRTEISEELGIPYLAKAAEVDAKAVVQASHGHIYKKKSGQYFHLLLMETRLIEFFSSWPRVLHQRIFQFR